MSRGSVYLLASRPRCIHALRVNSRTRSVYCVKRDRWVSFSFCHHCKLVGGDVGG